MGPGNEELEGHAEKPGLHPTSGKAMKEGQRAVKTLQRLNKQGLAMGRVWERNGEKGGALIRL